MRESRAISSFLQPGNNRRRLVLPCCVPDASGYTSERRIRLFQTHSCLALRILCFHSPEGGVTAVLPTLTSARSLTPIQSVSVGALIREIFKAFHSFPLACLSVSSGSRQYRHQCRLPDLRSAWDSMTLHNSGRHTVLPGSPSSFSRRET